MAAFSGAVLLQIWEAGQGRHPVDQALVMLAAAYPGQALEELAALSIGRRDAHLLAVYEQNFGSQLAGLADCPGCHTTMEFNLRVADIRQEPAAAAEDNGYPLASDGYTLRFRLPNSFDLAAIASAESSVAGGGVQGARKLLVQRCVLTAQGTDKAAEDALPESVVAAVAARMAGCDPQAEVALSFTCPECGREWEALLDIVTFLWAKISAQARGLLDQVHTLARAYGWAEREILAMSPARRRVYLEMVM